MMSGYNSKIFLLLYISVCSLLTISSFCIAAPQEEISVGEMVIRDWSSGNFNDLKKFLLSK
jgi:hypothetical protein